MGRCPELAGTQVLPTVLIRVIHKASSEVTLTRSSKPHFFICSWKYFKYAIPKYAGKYASIESVFFKLRHGETIPPPYSPAIPPLVLPEKYFSDVACVYDVGGKCKGMLTSDRFKTLCTAFHKAEQAGIHAFCLCHHGGAPPSLLQDKDSSRNGWAFTFRDKALSIAGQTFDRILRPPGLVRLPALLARPVSVLKTSMVETIHNTALKHRSHKCGPPRTNYRVSFTQSTTCVIYFWQKTILGGESQVWEMAKFAHLTNHWVCTPHLFWNYILFVTTTPCHKKSLNGAVGGQVWRCGCEM